MGFVDHADTCSTITHKLVRQKVEEDLGLESGETDQADYRKVIRAATEKLIVRRINRSEARHVHHLMDSGRSVG